MIICLDDWGTHVLRFKREKELVAWLGRKVRTILCHNRPRGMWLVLFPYCVYTLRIYIGVCVSTRYTYYGRDNRDGDFGERE